MGPGGTVTLRDVVRHPGGVAVLPVDGDQVWLIRQYRVAAGGRLLEIPAGKLDVDGESAEVAAARELEEELGVSPRRLVRLGAMLPSPGYTDELIHLYAADGIVPGERRPDGAEEVDAEVLRMPFAELIDRIGRGEVLDAKTQLAALAWAGRVGR